MPCDNVYEHCDAVYTRLDNFTSLHRRYMRYSVLLGIDAADPTTLQLCAAELRRIKVGRPALVKRIFKLLFTLFLSFYSNCGTMYTSLKPVLRSGMPHRGTALTLMNWKQSAKSLLVIYALWINVYVIGLRTLILWTFSRS